MDLMARSATPFSACISGGDSVLSTRSEDISLLNLFDVNSPAPSVCNEPIEDIVPPDFAATLLKLAMKDLMTPGASALSTKGKANLNLV